ncbi:MAG: hypothetical protein VZS44_06690 [Bacilli bacterium]|nr:hypothetical protein [Bacilli bacterium]
MGKDLREDLYICDLYQIDESAGYLKKNNLFLELYCGWVGVKKIDTIIAAKKKFKSKYGLTEVLTDIPFDTLYRVYKNGIPNRENLSYDGNKEEYDTFIIVRDRRDLISLDEINNYCDEHPDIEKYKNQLIELLNQGKENHINKKKQEKKEQDYINSEVNNKLYKRRSKKF